MEDTHIVQMYWDRNETAISESAMKYGTYCTSIAQNILRNPADAEECVNDTWLHAWNAMPPHRPSLLSTFLGKITRNLSFDLYRKMHRKKRGESQMDAVLDELEECVSGKDDIERQWEMKELIAQFRKTSDVIESNIFNSVRNINLRTVIGYHKDDWEYNFLDDYDKYRKEEDDEGQ